MPVFKVTRKLPARGKEVYSVTPYTEPSGVKMVKLRTIVQFGSVDPVESTTFMKASMFQSLAKRYLASLTRTQLGGEGE